MLSPIEVRDLSEARQNLGWERVPDGCPENVRVGICEIRSARLAAAAVQVRRESPMAAEIVESKRRRLRESGICF